MKFAFFRGCLIPVKQPHIEAVARKVLPQIGIELEDVKEFTCCPDPIWLHSANKLAWLSIAARNLSLAEEKGLNILTLCNGCAGTLIDAAHILKTDKEARRKVDEILANTGHKYEGKVQVKHVLDVLYKDVGTGRIKAALKKKLAGLKVATHTGCHLLSPHEILQFDDHENPVILDNLVAALGATPVDHPLKIQCCGSSLRAGGTDASARATVDKLNSMHDAGADCITLSCPSCLQQFDSGQVVAARQFNLSYKLPVLNYVQLLGLAMGHSLDDMGYQAHRVKSPEFEEKLKNLV